MAYFIVENFSQGLDHRRSPETAPPGSLRVLSNAFVNEGGEIEKRKAFVKDTTLTAYGQEANYKGKITGPHEVPGYPNAAYFRHRHNSLPAGFTAGGGSIAAKYEISGLQTTTFWVQKSTKALTNHGALMNARSTSLFATNSYVVEAYVDSVTLDYNFDHLYTGFTNDEPTSELSVVANDGRQMQMTLKAKGYLVSGNTLFGSAVNDPSDMVGTGFWVVDVTTQGRPIGEGLALGDYFGELAVFGKRGIQFWSVDADPTQNNYLRTISASIFSPRSVTGFGNGDVLFMGRDGIRSLQARDSSNLAQIADVGSPIDRILRDVIKYDATDTETMQIGGTAHVLPMAQFFSQAIAAVHPDTGHFWMCVGSKIYVLSNNTSLRSLSWSTFDVPVNDAANESASAGFDKSRWIADIAPINETLCFRNNADEVYIYGGPEGETYDTTQVIVELPPMEMDEPGHQKTFEGIDLVCQGTWSVQIGTGSHTDDGIFHWETVAQIQNTTRATAKIRVAAKGYQISVRLVSEGDGPARLGQVTIYYEVDVEK